MAAVGQTLQGSLQEAPAGLAHHAAAAPLRAQIRGDDAEPTYAKGAAEVATLRVAETVRQAIRPGHELEQGELLARHRTYALEHRAFLPFLGPAPPAVEDVVVVPHHQRGDGGEERRDLGLGPDLSVAGEVEGVGAFGHGRRERRGVARPPGQATPGGELGRILPDHVGVELVAALQQEVEGVARVLLGQLAPEGVARRRRWAVALIVVAVAGGVGDAAATCRGGQANGPALPADRVAGGGCRAAQRQREVVAPEGVAAAHGEELRRHRGTAARVQGRRRVVVVDRVVDHQGGKPAAIVGLAAKVQDRPDEPHRQRFLPSGGLPLGRRGCSKGERGGRAGVPRLAPAA